TRATSDAILITPAHALDDHQQRESSVPLVTLSQCKIKSDRLLAAATVRFG
ncbi:MAG: hypothetical protein JWQ90_5690, partial [Hydrocarboniphaga sp.]|nr:hypothetical protein [Hydrocarboniphaga sp.]